MSYGNEMTLGSVLHNGKELFKKHWLAVVLLQLVAGMSGNIINLKGSDNDLEVTKKVLQGDFDGAMALEEAPQVLTATDGLLTFIMAIIAIAISVFISLITARYLIKAARREENIDLTALIKSGLKGYLPYLLYNIVWGVLIVVGYIVLVIPGIYLTVRLLFLPYVVAEHPELGMKEAFSRAWQMTKGRFWQLLGYGIVSIIIDIIGFMLLFVGIIFSNAFVELMFSHVYAELTNENAAE